LSWFDSAPKYVLGHAGIFDVFTEKGKTQQLGLIRQSKLLVALHYLKR